MDRLLDSLTEADEHMRSLEWMTRKTMSQLEDGDGYRLDYTLKKIADRFNSEEFRIAVEEAGIDESMLYSEDKLNMLDEGCRRVIEGYSDALSASVEAIYAAFDAAGLDPFDTSRHFMSNNLKKYAALEKDEPVPMLTDSFRRNASDVTLWYPKAKKYMEGMVTAEIEEAVSSFLSLFDVEYKVYNTALQLRRQVYGFAVANDLYANYHAIMKEKNVLTIDQTNNILKGIIDGCDTPFIYEKSGVRYDHFLLDEFQDTSLVQWDNFRPLLENSVASGNENLIVGDVKQSIYRWRQSEWNLLENQVAEDFPDRTDFRSLDTNFRSCRDIVEFNNGFFKAAAEYMDCRYGEGDVIRRIYADVAQNVHHKDVRGMVEAKFCEKDSFYPCILEAVRNAVDKGYRLGEITILVRMNQEGGDIAEYLIANGIPVLSDDSLRISSSLTVRRMVSLLSGIDNPQDSMARHLASSLGMELPSSWHSLVDLSEELLRRLASADPDTYRAETLYIQSFMDIVLDYVTSEGNSLRGFLKKWAEDKSNISSPKSDGSVRIMTVHKSKGLDFPYVIFPSLESVSFYTFTSRWSRPDVEGTELAEVADGVYDVYLSGKSADTLFAERYREELLMQYVDNLNVLYVALTRASRAMSLIAPMPSGVELTDDGCIADDMKFSGFSQWTLAYLAREGGEAGFTREVSEDGCGVTFRKGLLPDPVHEDAPAACVMRTAFESWPLNPDGGVTGEADVYERGRLKFSSEGLDFFSEDGQTGASASNRIRGVVLHGILSRVVLPEDLHSSVRQAVLVGDLTYEEAEAAETLLSERIAGTESRGWFPADRNAVMNERELIDVDGGVYRPDRVVLSSGTVYVIDYKFGVHDPKYVRQIGRYADIFRRMGYADVRAALWYVQTGEVMEFRFTLVKVK